MIRYLTALLLVTCSCAQASYLPTSFFDDIERAADITPLSADESKPYTKDFGNIVVGTPLAVFKPRNVAQLSTLLHCCQQYEIKSSVRGKGSSAFGQAQAQGGIVIDMQDMKNGIRFFTMDHDMKPEQTVAAVRVSAHTTWETLIVQTLERGLTFPVTTDNLDLTIGGTLSFGGIGGRSKDKGSQADNVLEFEIATPAKGLLRCSPKENKDLFDAAPGGLGQFGAIVNCLIPLQVAPNTVTYYKLSYYDAAAFFRDQKRLFETGIFQHLKGNVGTEDGKRCYVIDAGLYHYHGRPDPEIGILEEFKPDKLTMENFPYHTFVNLVTLYVAKLSEAGCLKNPMPWYNVLVPEKHIQAHLARVLDTPYLTGDEPIIVYPMNSKFMNKTFFRRPEGIFYLCGILHNTSFTSRQDFPVQEVLERNYQLYKECRAFGGYRYPVDAIRFTKKDWIEHFGNTWDEFIRLKAEYDPKGILNTGHGIDCKEEILEKIFNDEEDKALGF